MLEEQKLEAAVSAEEKEEREKWLLQLETQISTIEENEKSLVKYGENFLRKKPSVAQAYSELFVDPKQQQLQTTRDQSYRVLKHTLTQGKTKFLNANNRVASLTGKYQAKITTLEEEAKKLNAEKAGYQQQLDGIKKEQRRLVTESLELFNRHEAQLTELLEQLATQSIKGSNLRRCQTSVKDATNWTKKLAEENSQEVPNFKLCKEYIIAAGTAYQASYDYVLELTHQQYMGGGNGPGNTQVAGGDIHAGDAQINAEGDVHVGNKIIIHIHQAAAQAIENITPQIQAAQKKLEDVDAKYELLQRRYQDKEKELTLKNAELEKQRSDLLVRDQASSSQLGRMQLERIAVEKGAAEQIEKTNEALTKTKQIAAQQAAAAVAEAVGKNEEIEKLKTKLQAVEAAVAKADIEKRSAEAMQKVQTEQTQKSEQVEKSQEAKILTLTQSKQAADQQIVQQGEGIEQLKTKVAALEAAKAEAAKQVAEEIEKLKAKLQAAKQAAAKSESVEKQAAEQAQKAQAAEVKAEQAQKAQAEQAQKAQAALAKAEQAQKAQAEQAQKAQAAGERGLNRGR